ncbi:hypothetical protein CDAR_396481 [Caerostris darwini]|uniref:Uncharacterized protein n=1 Tax=Caerostris darwini TaxID=1538125 RepID=A0AAV4T1X0_9ARAC|nr:hypothetical protein CDAR_396481 [Caerostris darwini]
MAHKLLHSPETFTRRHVRSNGEVQKLALRLPAGICSLSTRLLVECVHDDYCTFHFVSGKTNSHKQRPSLTQNSSLVVAVQYVSKVE